MKNKKNIENIENIEKEGKNMKKLGKLFIFMLVAIFTFSFSVKAEEPVTGTITIGGAVAGEEYNIYKIFDLESYDPTTGAYAYKITEAWRSFFAVGAPGNGYVDIDADGYVTANTLTDSTAAEFAKKALNWAKTNTIATAKPSVTATSGQPVTFTGLDLGYYLVDTTLGTLCSLGTTANTVTINEKNTVPTVTNESKEGSTFGVSNDAKIGDTVDYKTTVNAYKGAEGYEVHGTLGIGLTLDTSSFVVTDVTDSSKPKVLTAGEDYTVVTTGLSNNETFKIVFDQDYLDTVSGISGTPTKIEVEYSATLNENAVVGGEGNPSSVYLVYGQNDETSTVDVAKTYTWQTEYFKYYLASDGITKNALKDAIFVLSTSNNSSNAISLISLGNNVYRVAKNGETGTVTTITTDATGRFVIEGLDSGTYYLIETTAPSGYNKLSSPVTVVVESSVVTGNTMISSTKVNNTTVETVEVENKSGTILPTTGGVGTKLFILIGFVLFVSTGVILVTKKRMYNAG